MATYSRAINEIVSCPYDEVHRVLKSKLQLHIAKCKVNHPGKDLVACYFNARHYVERSELEFHLANCDDRLVMENKYSQSVDANNPLAFVNAVQEKYVEPTLPPSEESWDREMDIKPSAGYVPEKVKNGFAQDLGMMKRAERKNYYKALHAMPSDEAKPQENVAVPEVSTSQIRQPKAKAEEACRELPQYGLGRGQLCGVRSQDSRIAANIFGDVTAPRQPHTAHQGLATSRSVQNSNASANYDLNFPALG